MRWNFKFSNGFTGHGKACSIPVAMVFKRYYCAKCGTRLKKEQIHRLVTPQDKDYHQYHDIGSYPQRNYDLTEYRFYCPDCGERSTFEQQRIYARKQKEQGSRALK